MGLFVPYNFSSATLAPPNPNTIIITKKDLKLLFS